MVEIVPCLTDPSKRTQTRAPAFGSDMTAALPLRIHSVPIRIYLQYRIVVSFPCSVRKRGRSRNYTAGAVRPIPGPICNYRIVVPFCRRRKKPGEDEGRSWEFDSRSGTVPPVGAA